MLSMQAAEYTYSGLTGSNDWSSGTDWDFTPVSASDTTLTFTGTLGDGATLTSNNDVADPFILNLINFNYDGPATGVTPVVTLSGQELNFVADGSTNPQLRIVTGTAIEPSYIINNDIQISDPLTLYTGTLTNGLIISTYNGQISGTGKITITGGTRQQGTTILTNTANDWSGDIEVRTGGTVSYTRRLQLGASEVIPDGAGKGNLSLYANGEGTHTSLFQLNGFNETINGLQADYVDNMRNKDQNQQVQNGGATDSTLTIGANDTTANFMGRLADGVGGGKLNIVKTGSGTQTFAGNATYTGDTTINGGKIEVDYTQLGKTETSDPSNYFSPDSTLTMAGGTTFAIKGRANGASVTDSVVTQQYGNYITVSSQAIADQLVVGQSINLSSHGNEFITGIVGARIYTNSRTGGGAQTLTTTASTGTTSQELAGLTLSGADGSTATLDFGDTDTVIMTINSAPVQLIDGSTLTIANWGGSLSGGGGDQLIFSGNSSEFSSVFSQSEVTFDGYGAGYTLIDGGGSYEVTAIPEPVSLVLLLVSGLTFFAATRRRR